MIIKHPCNLDFVNRQVRQNIHVVQGDCDSRVLELHLLEEGKNWNLPQDASVALRFLKPDGTGGIYDKMPDGSPAWSAAENVVEMMLPAQLTSAAGYVDCQLMVSRGTEILSSFAFGITVEGDTVLDAVESEGYWNWSEFIQGPSAYQVAVANGFEGDESSWLASLIGPVGPAGPVGETGERGERGPAGEQGKTGRDGVSPEILVHRTDGGYIITVTDARGTEEFTLLHGRDCNSGEAADQLLLRSSTSGSQKIFAVTVVDNGMLITREVN